MLGAVLAVLLAAAPSPKAKAAFERGEESLRSNRFLEAEAAYREALAATPEYAAALNGLGSALFKQTKKDEAIAAFKDAVRVDPSLALAYFNLGYAARKNNDFATAATAYEKYTELNPTDADGFYGLADSYRQSGEKQKAVTAYEQFVAKETRPSEQKWINKAKESIAALKAQLAAPAKPGGGKSPSGSEAAASASATGAGGRAAGSNGDSPRPALIAALSAKKIADGDRQMNEKKFREASFSYQDAVNADPANLEALFKLANSYAVLGYYAQAIERWKQVTAASPEASVRKNAQDNINKAQAKMNQSGGGSPQAQGLAPGSGPIADTTRAQARKAYEQGVTFINQRNYPGAINTLSQAIQLEPNLAVAYVARGSAHIGVKRYSEAAADYAYALRLDAKMASPLYGLAEAYRAMGRATDARQYYEKYIASAASDVRPELQTEAKTKVEKLR